MSIRGACGLVFAAAAVMTLGGLPGRERPVVALAGPEVLRLEADVAAHPDDLRLRTDLAQAYLDAKSPGLAWSTLAEASDAQQQDPAALHLEARVLIEQGNAPGALALERRVLSTCGEGETRPGCTFWLVVSATRRAEILQELVKHGVDDAVAQPEASLVAYHAATHEARVSILE